MTGSDGRLFQAMTLLLAACEQTAYELDQAEVGIGGLGVELQALSVRLHDVLGQDRWRSAT